MCFPPLVAVRIEPVAEWPHFRIVLSRTGRSFARNHDVVEIGHVMDEPRKTPMHTLGFGRHDPSQVTCVICFAARADIRARRKAPIVSVVGGTTAGRALR